MSDTFNTAGVQGRDCPICLRIGTLAGVRDGDHPKLTCAGCFNIFELTWASVPGMPDTLTRVRAAPPRFVPHWKLTPSGQVKR